MAHRNWSVRSPQNLNNIKNLDPPRHTPARPWRGGSLGLLLLAVALGWAPAAAAQPACAINPIFSPYSYSPNYGVGDSILDLVSDYHGTPMISGDGNRVLLMRGRANIDLTGENADGSTELYLYDIPTETYTQITDSFGANFAGYYAISENGNRVAFTSSSSLTGENPEGHSQVFLYDYPTDTLTQVTSGESATLGVFIRLSFSSDGNRVVFRNGNRNEGTVYVYDVPTDDLITIHSTHRGGEVDFGLHDHEQPEHYRGLNSDGTSLLLFSSSTPPTAKEYDIATGSTHEIVYPTEYHVTPYPYVVLDQDWEKVMLLITADEVYVRDLSTDTLTQVTEDGVFPTIVRPPGVPLTGVKREDSPRFYRGRMPRGRQVLFAAPPAMSNSARFVFVSTLPHREAPEIFLFDAQTSILTQLTDSRHPPLAGKELYPTYLSPDGNVLIFTGYWDSDGDGKIDMGDIFRYDVPTTTLTPLFTTGSAPIGNRRVGVWRVLDPDTIFLGVHTSLGTTTNTFASGQDSLDSLYRATCSATGAVTHPPAAPAPPEVRSGSGQLTLTWSAPAANGAAIQTYTVQWKESSYSQWFWEGIAVGRTTLPARGGSMTYTITGLDNDTTYKIRVRASNAGGRGDYSAATTGSPRADQAPQFGSGTYEATLTVGEPVTLTLPAATGGDGALRYTLSPLPVGLSFDSQTRVLSGTPTSSQTATTLTYTVTDSDASDPDRDTRTFTLTILPADTEQLRFGSGTYEATLTVGEPVTLTLPAATGGDGALRYTLSPLPVGLSFDSQTRVLSGTPTSSQTATTLTYTVTDSDASDPDRDTRTFTLTILPADTEQLRFGSGTYEATLTVGEPVTLTLPAATGGDGALRYTLSPLPVGLSFDSQTRVLSGTPTSSQTATTLTYTVTDSDASDPDRDTRTFTLTILPENRGVLENPGPLSFQSGIGVLSGWVCEAETLEVELNGERHEAGYGTERLDTEGVCGDTDNGFGLLWNWNRLGSGWHTVRVLVDGAELDRSTFKVTVLIPEEPFHRLPPELRRPIPLADFPAVGERTTIQWQDAQQNFAITTGAGGGTGAHRDLTQAALENPAPGSFQSGVQVLSGWVCEAETVVLEVDGTWQLTAAYGTERPDTASVCGDTDNGFGLLFNWNRLSDGPHTMRLLVDGEEWATATFTVTTLGEEFRRGLAGQYTVEDFPRPGESVTVEWQEAQQNFVITAVK